jgi:YggT family protein
MGREFGLLLINSVDFFCLVLSALVLVRVILSWLPIDTRSNPLLVFVYVLTDPLINPIRRLLQRSPLGGRGMRLDFSPIFVLLMLRLAQTLVTDVIRTFIA